MRITTLCVAAFAVLIPTAAGGQTAPNQEFSALRFVPAVGPANYGMVDGAWVGGHLTPSALIVIDYAHRPFVLYEAQCTEGDEDCDLDDEAHDLVAYQMTANVGGSLSFAERLQVGVLVPVVATAGDGFHASRGIPDSRPIRVRGGEAFALADPRLSLKATLLGEPGAGFMLAAVAYGTAPIGEALAPGRGIGNSGPTAGGHLVAEMHLPALRVAANLGGIYRKRAVLLATESGSELTYGVAAKLDITPRVGATAELTGASRLSGQQDENPAEVRVLGDLEADDLHFVLGGGVGLVGGVGVPNFRIFGGAMFAPESADSDGDGIRDKDDKCPGVAEDFDDYLDDDGCPETDNDADGHPDTADRCPDKAEDIDGHEDEDGCPDPDNDADGVLDGYDACPAEQEDMDGDRDEDGCPDNDRDRDGVDDDQDQCPDKPEDTDGFGDEDGCPEVDFDGDGIPDDGDLCPDEVEDMDGVEDDDGCPEADRPAPAGRGRRQRR